MLKVVKLLSNKINLEFVDKLSSNTLELISIVEVKVCLSEGLSFDPKLTVR